jgi:hypothetical protein
LLSQEDVLEISGVVKVVRGAAESGVLARKRWLVVGSRSAGLKVVDQAWTPGASAREITEKTDHGR